MFPRSLTGDELLIFYVNPFETSFLSPHIRLAIVYLINCFLSSVINKTQNTSPMPKSQAHYHLFFKDYALSPLLFRRAAA